MPRRDPVLTRRSILTGLAVGGGVAAGVALAGGFGRESQPGRPALGEDTPRPRPYMPPEGAVDVPPPRREFYLDAAESDGQTFGDLFLPASANPHLPIVVLVHGGGWEDDLGHEYMENFARDLASFDVAVWNIEYRRVGSGGGWPTTVADVCHAIDHLRHLSVGMSGRLDLGRVAVAGHSSGGHLALWAAGRRALPENLPGAKPQVPVVGCVSMAGVADLLRAEATGDRYVAALLGGSPSDKHQRYVDASPIEHLPTGIPVLCMHGSDDRVVLPEQSEDYVRRAQAAGDPARLEIVEGRHDPWGDVKGPAWQSARGTLLEMVGKSVQGAAPAPAPSSGPAPAPSPGAPTP